MDAVRRVLEEVEALEVPLLEVYNKVDALTADERRRLQEQDQSALLISALTKDGVDDLVETVASRLALDVVRMSLTFNPDDEGDRERIARLYRHARVVVHEERDDRIVIVADVPRRLVDRVQPPRR
jgi:GTP-binding protein HflX